MKYYNMSFEQLRKAHVYSVVGVACSLAAFLGLMAVSISGFAVPMAWALIVMFVAFSMVAGSGSRKNNIVYEKMICKFCGAGLTWMAGSKTWHCTNCDEDTKAEAQKCRTLDSWFKDDSAERARFVDLRGPPKKK